MTGQPDLQSGAEQGALPVSRVDWLGWKPEGQAKAVLGSQAAETVQLDAEALPAEDQLTPNGSKPLDMSWKEYRQIKKSKKKGKSKGESRKGSGKQSGQKG